MLLPTPKKMGTDVNHDWLKPDNEIVIDEPGFIYIWLSNESESPLEVYFDDLKVTLVKSPVIQQDEYYPLGMVSQSFQRENSPPNQYLYNGMEKQDELDLGWYDYIARQYDPAIGRFLSIDPLADISRRWSPSTYAYDNPIRFTDPDGMLPEDKVEEGKRPRGATVQEGDHEDRTITVTRSGNEGEYSHTTTETHTKTNGSYQRDADGNLQWKETKSTTTSSTVTDANGDAVSSSQTVSSSENVFAVKEATQLKLFGPDEKVDMVGDAVSSKSQTSTSDKISNASSEFMSAVSMTADYSRETNGLSVTHTNRNWMIQSLSNNTDENGMPNAGAMVALSLPARNEGNPTQTFYKSCGSNVLSCSIHDKYLRSIRAGTAGYIQTK